MTKDYHLTQKQTLELANEVEAAGFDITVYLDGDVEGHTVDAFQALINAALDKVLGEPVAYMATPTPIAHPLLARDLTFHQPIQKEDWQITKLYAPKVSTCPPHKWDKSGEKCLVCGDKDWMD